MMEQKFLLREYYELCDGGVCQDLLTEEEKRFVANGGMMLSGIIQRSDTVNGNGRVYPHNVLVREMKNYENHKRFTRKSNSNRQKRKEARDRNYSPEEREKKS